MALEEIFEGLDFSFKSSQEKYNLISSLLPAFIENDIGVTSSMSIFREAGFSFTDSVFRDLYRSVTGETIQSGRIKYVSLDSTPTDAVFDYAKYNQTARYRYRLEYEITSYEGDLVESRYYDFDTNFKSSIRSIQDAILDHIQETYPVTDGEITRYRVKAAWIDERYT